jgi:prepilin-type processing-associated H-X9-DG protein
LALPDEGNCMTPPLPGQGPEGRIQIGVDLTLLDRMVLAALELRGTENEQNLQKNAAIFQNTNDPKLRAFKVHLAEDVFGRLAGDAVAASKDASHAGLLWALGTGLASWFDAGDLEAVWKYMRAPDDVPDSRPYTFALDDGLRTPDGLKIVGTNIMFIDGHVKFGGQNLEDTFAGHGIVPPFVYYNLKDYPGADL